MSLAVGPISALNVSDTSAKLAVAAATGGVSPYAYQWYKSQTPGFTPGGGNIIAGATALTLDQSAFIPNSVWYYKVVVTDTGNSNATATSAQFTLTLNPQSLNPNSFAQSPVAGKTDMLRNLNTVSVQVDVSQATPLYPGMAVKMVDNAGGVPKVVGCSANSDEVMGFINFNAKDVAYLAGMPMEISMAGNVMFLWATGAIARGAQVQLDISSPAAVAQLVGSSGADVVGWAYDKASNAGDLIRVFIRTPSFLKA